MQVAANIMRPTCLNGGTVAVGNSSLCDCPTPYTGDNCESTRCRNGGQPDTNGKCKCSATWKGELCADPICHNGGLPVADGCICPDANFIGRHCELPVCKNGGTAASLMHCRCPKLYGGNFCEEFCVGGLATGNICEFIECQNGGVPIMENLSCSCPTGYSGQHCERLSCGLNGKLSLDGTKCDCSPFYSGTRCDVVSCDHGVLLVEGHCDCPLWLQGNYCERISSDVYLMAGIFGFIPLLFLVLFCSLKFNRSFKRGRNPFEPGTNGLLSSIADTNGANTTRTSRASLARIPELNLDFYDDEINLSTSHGISPILPEYEEAVVYFPHPQTLYHHMWRHQPPPSYEAVAKGQLSRGKMAGSYTFDSAVSLYCQRAKGIPNSMST